LHVSRVAPFCSDRNASAFAVELTATSRATDPNTDASALFIYLSSGETQVWVD